MKYIAKTFKLFIPILVFGIYVLFIFLQDAVIGDKNSVWAQAIGEFVLSALYVVSIVCISRALFRKSTKKVRCDWRIVSFLVFLYPGIRLLFDRFSIFMMNMMGKEYTLTVDLDTYSLPQYFIIIVSGVIYAPLIEEYTFRKVILDMYNTRWGKIYAMLVTSMIFGWSHTSESRLACFMVGIFYSLLYLWTDNISFTICIHMLSNLFATVAYFIGMKVNDAAILSNYGRTIYCDTRILITLLFMSAVSCLVYFGSNRSRSLKNGNIDS